MPDASTARGAAPAASGAGATPVKPRRDWRIAVASGKGGTGKTTVAVNLALSSRGPVQLLDCDVEAPNARLFLSLTDVRRNAVTIPIPEVDQTRCTACGQCGEICAYNAIVAMGAPPIVFPRLCHGCGGCMRICPRHAIREVPREIGAVAVAGNGHLRFVEGELTIGEAMAPPVIRAVWSELAPGTPAIIDAPPGTTCPTIEAVRGSDVVALVTEPTPFGLHDLELAVAMVRALGLPHGVIVNRMGIGDDRIQRYCEREGVAVLAEIADDRSIAEAYARGIPLVTAQPQYAARFHELRARLEELAAQGTQHAQGGAGGDGCDAQEVS